MTAESVGFRDGIINKLTCTTLRASKGVARGDNKTTVVRGSSHRNGVRFNGHTLSRLHL